MKRTVTRFFSACFAMMLGIGCCSVPANAKVIEPEVVKTESWTTSYYIDDNVDTLYPYIQCEADIYNDGTIKLYMWNTHEWDGIAIVQHNITLAASSFSDATAYNIKYNYPMEYEKGTGSAKVISNDFPECDLSFCDKQYKAIKCQPIFSTPTYTPSLSESTKSVQYHYAIDDGLWDGTYPYTGKIIYFSYLTTLTELPTYSQRPDNPTYIFTTEEDLSNTYTFRLFSHDITISPEVLSGSVYIEQLKQENAALKAQIAAFDSDGDGFLTSADAQMILIYYTEYLAGATSGKTGDYAAFIQTFKGK